MPWRRTKTWRRSTASWSRFPTPRPACITANMVMANPDFAAIRRSGFEEYVYRTGGVDAGGLFGAAKCRRSVARGDGAPGCFARNSTPASTSAGGRGSALRSGQPKRLETFDLGMCGVPRAVSKEKQSFFEPVYIGASADESRSLDVRARWCVRVCCLKASSASGRCRRLRAELRMDRHNGRGLGGERGPLHPGRVPSIRRGRSAAARALPGAKNTPQRPAYLVRNATFEPAKQLRGEPWRGCTGPDHAGVPFRDSGDRHQPPGELRRLDRRGEPQAGARSTGSPVGERCFALQPEVRSRRPTGLHDRARYPPRPAALMKREGGAFPPAGGVNAGLCDVKQGG